MPQERQEHHPGPVSDLIPTRVSLTCVIPFVLGSALVLSLLSIPQKILLGANPLAPGGYIIPVFFGGAVGLAIGILFRRNRIQFLQRLSHQAQINDQLAASEARLRMLADNAQDAIFQWSLTENRYTYLSPAVHALTGYLPEDFMVNPGLFLTLVHPEDRPRLKDMARQVHEACLPPEIDYRLIHKSGREVFVNQRHAVALDATGHLLALEGLCTDMTSHVLGLKEKARMQEELVQSQKMEAVGNLASGISHDFNNLLTVINGYTELLLDLHPPESEGYKELQSILKAGQKASELTLQLLTFSRKQITRPRRVDFAAVIAETLQMLRRVLGSNIELVNLIPDDLPPVFIDTVQMDQVVMNLVINAQDAMPKGGTLNIRAHHGPSENLFCENCGQPIEGHMVVLEIADTGDGMDEATRRRVFDPFFTTKAPGQGSGLGLSTVFGIIHQNHGHVRVDSRLGEGSVFQVFLPAMTEEATVVPTEADEEEAVPRGTETVLLVEDESLVRSLAAAIMEQYGYQVLLAEDGPSALALFEGRSQGIDLVLTDVIMPRMSGVELAEQLRDRAPAIRIIFMSGYLDEKVDLGNFKTAPFLQKPFGSERLARLLRQVLDGDFQA